MLGVVEVAVSRRSPFVVRLSSEDRAMLEERAGSRTGSQRAVVRARIVLLAADGLQNVDIAARVGVCVDVAVAVAEAVLPGRALPVSPTAPGRAGRAGSGPRWWPGSRRWRASRPSSARCRCRGGARPSSPTKPSARVSCRRSRRRRCGAGCTPTRSSRGVPVVDLPARPRLRRQGGPGPGPLRPGLGRRRRSAPTTT